MNRKSSENDEQRLVVDVFHVEGSGFQDPPDDCIGLALQIHGMQAIALLEAEGGKHTFQRRNMPQETCVVEGCGSAIVHYQPPAFVGRSGAFRDQRERRTYDFSEEISHDLVLDRDFAMRGGQIKTAVAAATRTYLSQRIWEQIEAWS